MHAEVLEFIEHFEQDAKATRKYRNKLDQIGIIALEQVIGPVLNYRFKGLKAEYPFVDSKGGQRFIDFVYIRGSLRIVIEIDGFTTHMRNISYQEYDDHQDRQNDLVLSGWIVIRFTPNQIENRASHCIGKLTQAIGFWWSLAHGEFSPEEAGAWSLRKRLLIELSLRQGGTLRTNDVIHEFHIHQRTAHHWLTRFMNENIFTPIRSAQRIIGYKLTGYDEL